MRGGEMLPMPPPGALEPEHLKEAEAQVRAGVSGKVAYS